MTTFVNNDVSSGNVIYASDHNTQGALIANVLNGGIEAENLASNAVTTAKIADSAATTAKLANGAVTSAKTTATTYVANVTTSGTVTSSTHANFPTNRCYVDVVTTIANAKVLVAYSADTAYAAATGSALLRFAYTNANTGNATYERRAQNSDASQRVPVAYTEIVTLANAGTTRIEMQLRGSSTAACVAENVVLTAQVLQG